MQIGLTEVVSAEDIGKMPDQNVADSLARLPGVTTSAAGANEVVSMKMTASACAAPNPSLTQTLINGPRRRCRRLVRASIRCRLSAAA